eukprot:7391365-Alexandrium_andersonii.AAC.1
MWAFFSPLANATIPGGSVLTLQACCTVLPALAVTVYSWCQSLALSFSCCHHVERLAILFHAAFRAA